MNVELTRKNLLIVIFIYLSIFINSYVLFKSPFEFYFGYLIYILLLPVFILRYGINQSLVLIFLVLLITGVVNIFMGQDTTVLFLKVFTGLFLSYFFYYYVVLEFDFNIELLFKWYLKGAYIASVIGLIQFISYKLNFVPGYNYDYILNKWGVVIGGNFGIRINSVFGEPTHLAAVLSAAFFTSLYSLTQRKPYIPYYQSVIIVVVYFLSFSGLGQSGIFVSLILLAINFGFMRYFFVFIPLGVFIFFVMYNNVSEFRDRLDSLIDLFSSGGNFVLGKTHGSSFILYNNYQVAMQNIKNNLFFGTGIGSHPIAFEKYSVAKDIQVYGFNLNSADANSMLLRLISETGLFGVVIFLYIIIKCYVKRNREVNSFHWLVSNSILVMILLNLFRQGHYFLNGFPFFVILYFYNYKAYNQYLDELSNDSPPGETTT